MADDQYATAKQLLGSLPKWVGDKETQNRLASYALYEDIYWNVPEAFKLLARGSDSKPIYVPAAKTIVETYNRYLAPSATVIADPTFGTPEDQQAANLLISGFLRREKFLSKFNMNKRFGIIRGDSAWYLHGDPLKPEGARVSMFAINPGKLFPIYNPENIEELVGWHIAEPIVDEAGKDLIHRTTFMKQTGTSGPSQIVMTDELYEWDKSGLPGVEQGSPYKTIASGVLPSPIDYLPIYVIPNFSQPDSIWGSSELRGLERILGAINQSISDEELTIAMDGLGMYATDAGTPVDDNGDDASWNLGPARVVELPTGTSMKRISGVLSVAPYQDHLKYLHERIDESMGLSPIAKGRVDVQVAESGIALQLELAPILMKAEEGEAIINDVGGNLFFDLPKWLVAYEGSDYNPLLEKVRLIPKYGERVPANKKQQVEEILALLEAGVIDDVYARSKLRKLGYEDMDEAAIVAGLAAQGDAMGARVDQTVRSELDAANALRDQG